MSLSCVTTSSCGSRSAMMILRPPTGYTSTLRCVCECVCVCEGVWVWGVRGCVWCGCVQESIIKEFGNNYYCCLEASGGSGRSDWSVTKQEVTLLSQYIWCKAMLRSILSLFIMDSWCVCVCVCVCDMWGCVITSVCIGVSKMPLNNREEWWV